MRQLITFVVVGSMLVVALALYEASQTHEDDLAQSIAQLVQTSD